MRKRMYRLDELMDITAVAKALGQPVQNVQNLRMRAINNKIGTPVGKLGRVYTPADVAALQRLIDAQTGPTTKTLIKKARVLKLKEAGLSHTEIARRMGVHPSYIPKLLKLG